MGPGAEWGSFPSESHDEDIYLGRKELHCSGYRRCGVRRLAAFQIMRRPHGQSIEQIRIIVPPLIRSLNIADVSPISIAALIRKQHSQNS